jgi:hypothetical protein
MRKLTMILAGVAALAAPVCVYGTGFGSLVSSFKSPDAWPLGLAYRPGRIYIATLACGVVWEVTKAGSIINYHPVNLGGVCGLTRGTISGNTYYWLADEGTKRIYRYVDNSSSIHGSFPAPGPKPWGLSFVDANHMYHTDEGDGVYIDPKLYLLHPVNGSVYASYKLSFRPGDIAYDDSGYLWITGPNVAVKSVFRCTLTGSPIASFSVAQYGHPGGCAYDGEYLWLGVYEITIPFHAIMRFSLREEPAVEPASLGRVKALYR